MIHLGKQMLKADPKNAAAYIYMAIASAKKKDEVSAIGYFSKAIALDWRRGDAHFFRASLYTNAGKYEKALADINAAISNPRASAQILRLNKTLGAKTTEDKVRALLFHGRSEISLGQNRLKQAMADANKALDMHPTPLSRLYTLRARIFFKQRQFDIAKKDCKKAVGIYAKDRIAWNLMGLIAFYNGKFSEAITHYEKALDIYANDRTIQHNLAQALWVNDSRTSAVKIMEDLVKNVPTANRHFNMGYFQHELNNRNRAVRHYQAAKKMNQNIIKNQEDTINFLPMFSFAKPFYQATVETAKLYIPPQKSGGTGVAASLTLGAVQSKIIIKRLSIEPAPVPMNEPFDIQVLFQADIRNATANQIPVQVWFTIEQENDVLFKTIVAEVKADVGKITSWIQHMDPVPARGTFTVIAKVQFKNIQTEKQVVLTIR